jgi:ribonuclease HII
MPSFVEEELLAAQGYRLIAGVDEVGRGALAGPVVAAAVILPLDLDTPWLDEVRDSKLLTPQQRQLFFHHIQQVAIAIGIGATTHDQIDKKGIVSATRLAMKQAIERLSPPPQSLLIDYLSLPEVCLPQKGITDGDNLCLSIACASIVAKVARDCLMVALDGVYSGYGLARNKGYGTEEHLASLFRLGPCSIHRRSFSPVKDIMLHQRLFGEIR